MPANRPLEQADRLVTSLADPAPRQPSSLPKLVFGQERESQMTKIDRLSVNCGRCHKVTDQLILLSTNTCGSGDLDLRPPAMRRSTMHTWIQHCPHCDLCAPDISDPPSASLAPDSETYQAVLRDQRFPELARRFLAFASVMASAHPDEAAEAYLHSAWLCDDAGLSDQAREFRVHSSECFRRAGPFPNTDDGHALGACFVDVLRRSGQFDAAAAACIEQLSRTDLPSEVLCVLKFQQDLIVRRDIEAHKLDECGELA